MALYFCDMPSSNRSSQSNHKKNIRKSQLTFYKIPPENCQDHEKQEKLKNYWSQEESEEMDI